MRRSSSTIRTRPIYTHARFLPGSRLVDCTVRDAIVAEGCYLDRCTIEESVVGIRTTSSAAPTITRSVLLGADYLRGRRCGAGAGRRVRASASAATSCWTASSSTRTRGSATARGWSTKAGLEHADGDGYYIRNGVIIVPKDGVINREP